MTIDGYLKSINQHIILFFKVLWHYYEADWVVCHVSLNEKDGQILVESKIHQRIVPGTRLPLIPCFGKGFDVPKFFVPVL